MSESMPPSPALPAPSPFQRFRIGHAAHADWRTCVGKVVEQLGEPTSSADPVARASLGIVYIGAPLAERMSDIHGLLRQRTGVVDWVGTTGAALVAAGTCYADEPAVVVMLLSLPSGSFHVFNGAERPRSLGSKTPSGADACWSALVHVDPSMPDVAGLVTDMASKVESGHLFGSIAGGDPAPLPQIANRPLLGGLSGAIFGSEVAVRTRVTHGCVPIAASHRISRCEENLLLELDGHPALDILLQDLGVAEGIRHSRDGEALLGALPASRLERGLYAGVGAGNSSSARGIADFRVRSVMGIDPQNRVVAIGGAADVGDQLVFCTRDASATHQALMAMLTAAREEIESERLAVKGALFFTCSGRGDTLSGQVAHEASLLAANLGDFPLIGMAGNGEIAGHNLHSHSAVLTLFT